MDKIIYTNYKLSLKQKYNAVCFDIDGTLTQKNSKKIDIRAINIILNLLKNKIPVVFITGRGETGLNDLKNDIYNSIKNTHNITKEDIKRIYALTNDGARLFFSNDITIDSFLSSNVYISTNNELEQLNMVNDIVKQIRSKHFDITYSKDTKTNTIINIRLVFNTNAEENIDDIYVKLVDTIAANNFKDIHITRGIYKGTSVIQIGTATKDIAIKRVEKIIGIPENSMIRIGDCGDLNGNDYSMLNCKQGYSVDKTCGSLDKCFPIFDKNGNVLKGVEATLELINTAKILPTVCLEKADKTKYKLNFAMTEKNIVSGRKILLNKYNNLININFDENNGIDALFDKNSGSVLLPMYEWEILPFSNPLKEFWSLKNNNCYKYVMRDDNNFLLRGSSTYYYFIANRISINDKDITSKNDVLRWYNNYIEFFKEAACAIFQTDNINFTINKRLILGILDNCRNALLIIMNNILVSKSINNNILMDISKKDNKLYFEIYKLLLKIESIMSYMCFKTNYLIDKNLICDVIHQTEKILEDNLLIEKLAKNKEDYSKDYRAYREIDNFGENYIAVSLYRERRNNIEIPINVCGLSYGGIELPIIAKILAKNRIEKILLLKFSKEVSRYSNKQLIDLRNFNINEHGGLLNFETFQETSLDLFDDNVLTGKTLQLAIISLYDYNINVKNICIVRYPGINRIEQMFLNTVAAIDYHLFFDYIYGL